MDLRELADFIADLSDNDLPTRLHATATALEVAEAKALKEKVLAGWSASELAAEQERCRQEQEGA